MTGAVVLLALVTGLYAASARAIGAALGAGGPVDHRLLPLPALGAACLTLATLAPGDPTLWLKLTCPCGTDGALHVCPLHPAALTALWPAAALVLTVGLVPTIPRALALVRRVLATRTLVRSATPAGPVYEIDAGGPLACAVGIRSPRVVVDRTWWRSLSEEDRRIVLAHERAHLRNGDLGARLRAELLAWAWRPERAEALLADWEAEAERRADAAAAQEIGDRLRIADLLVRVARQAGGARPPVLALRGADLPTRIRALIDPPTPRPRPPLRWPALALGAALLLGPALHRGLEHLLNP